MNSPATARWSIDPQPTPRVTERVLRLLYNALWYPALPLAMRFSGAHAGDDQRERRGRMPIAPGGSPRIWIHAASVGEVEGVRPIALGLKRDFPGAAIVITTMTTTGRDAARARIPNAAAWMLAPFDHVAAVRSFLAQARPQLVLIAETEVWPNFLVEAHRFGAKLAIVNGRMSQRSADRYAKMRSLFGAALSCADLVMVQTVDDARRYALQGVPHDRIVETGNTKFDLEASDSRLRPVLEDFAAGRPILIAGSTGPGEEAAVASAFVELRTRFPELALIVAPRHLDRVAEAAAALGAAGLEVVPARDLTSGQARVASVLLLDTMGELRALYQRCAIAFVGGSLFEGRGGQSPIEPAAASVPILIGPHHENQRVVVDSLVRAGGARIVNDARELGDACATWLADEAARRGAGEHARAALAEANGATRRTLMRLRALISLP
jgi:3-deoxy-D-manno-octulosonic-acid transferase